MKRACAVSALIIGVLAWQAAPAASLEREPAASLEAALAASFAAAPPTRLAAAPDESLAAAPAPRGGQAGPPAHPAEPPIAPQPPTTPEVGVWIAPGGATPTAALAHSPSPSDTTAGASPQGPSGARRLVAVAFDQLSATAAAARGEVPQGGPGRQEVFWGAMVALQQDLEDLDGTLAAHDARFVLALDGAERALVALAVASGRSAGSGGGAAPETARRLGTLTETMSRLRAAYSREALRARRGSPLSAAEQAQLQRVALAARRWQALLAAVEAEARRQGDTALLVVLRQIDGQLRQVSASPPTLAGFLGSLQTSEDALDLWAGNAAFVGPAEQDAWQEADVGASDLTTATDTGFVFAADLGSGKSWSYIEGSAPPDAGPPADAAASSADEDTAEMSAPSAEAAGGEPLLPDSTGAGTELAGGGAPPASSPPASEPLLEAPGTAETMLRTAEGAEAAMPAPGDTAPDSPWIVIHGGATPAYPSDASPATAAGSELALQLGDLSDTDMPAGDPDPPAESDLDAAPPFGGQQLCRPWHPYVAVALCPLHPPSI